MIQAQVSTPFFSKHIHFMTLTNYYWNTNYRVDYKRNFNCFTDTAIVNYINKLKTCILVTCYSIFSRFSTNLNDIVEKHNKDIRNAENMVYS